MSPRGLIAVWVELFNAADAEGLPCLYAEDAVNHQVPDEPVHGRVNIRRMFQEEFANFNMETLVENIFEEGDVGILGWKSPRDLRGCGFFWFKGDEIVAQRGYCYKLSLLKEQ